jgi:hypothetical protein
LDGVAEHHLIGWSIPIYISSGGKMWRAFPPEASRSLGEGGWESWPAKGRTDRALVGWDKSLRESLPLPSSLQTGEGTAEGIFGAGNIDLVTASGGLAEALLSALARSLSPLNIDFAALLTGFREDRNLVVKHLNEPSINSD